MINNLSNAAVGAMLVLTSPTGGERWNAGSAHRITWVTPDKDGEFRLDYSVDGGKSWKPIAEKAGAEHVPGLAVSQRAASQFLWKIPEGTSACCRVRVASADKPEIQAVSRSDFAIGPSQAAPEYRWSCATLKAPFAGRDGAGALVYQGRMWFLGGWNPGDKANFPKICNNEVWSSVDGQAWDLVKPNTFKDGLYDPGKDWEGRHTAGYAVFQDRMWIVGGDCNQKHYHPDVWERHVEFAPWPARSYHDVAVFDDKLWVLEGANEHLGWPKNRNDVWYSSDGVNWYELADTPWKPRHAASVFAHAGALWIAAGNNMFPDVWKLQRMKGGQ